ncbi:MAG: ECF-family polymerase sigma factor [Myxococcaceae bacterium]|nr:ECF-family polymerase sigma factor [Myxococcaceae bacterium]
MKSVSELEEHRSALTGHCYRMLGSLLDADDAVQETMVRAWRSLDGFDGRASLRTWLYRIATHVCLDALTDKARRERPIDAGPLGRPDDVLETWPGSRWLEPIPDAMALPQLADPAELAVQRQSIQLAFVAALQHLPPKQRAVLLLTEVLGWSASDVSDSLQTSLAAVNSALQRARATLASANLREAMERPATLSEAQSEVVQRYVRAFERYDIDTLTTLLHEEATLSMPPYTLWLRGKDPIRSWMLGPGAGCRGSRLLPVAACGSPAFAQYRPHVQDGFTPWALIVLELAGERIVSVTSFLDVQTLFPRFGLPSLPPG